MEKTLTQRLNEVNVEAAEILLEEMKKAQGKDDMFALTNYADSISKMRVNAEPMDLTADLMKMVFSKTLPMPGGQPDDYDEKKHSGLIEE